MFAEADHLIRMACMFRHILYLCFQVDRVSTRSSEEIYAFSVVNCIPRAALNLLLSS